MRSRAVSLACLAGSLLARTDSTAATVRVERRFVVMATYATAEVYGPDEATAVAAIDEIRRVFDRVDATMSNWSEASALSAVNRGAGARAVRVPDPDLFRCIARSLEFAERTGGAFDPTVGALMRAWGFRPRAPRVPGEAEVAEARRHVGWRKVVVDRDAKTVRFEDAGVEVDLGGIAKGYALDLAAGVLARSRCRAALIDLGGNLVAWRGAPGSRAFVLGVRDPFDAERLAGTIEVRDRFVSTSADYENSFRKDGKTYGHIMDAASGRPAESDVIAATVIARRGDASDALSTALFVAGSAGAASILARTTGVAAILVLRSERGTAIRASRSLRKSFQVDPAFRERLTADVEYVLPN